MSNHSMSAQFALGLAVANYSVEQDSKHWAHVQPMLLNDRWSMSFPYQLLVVRLLPDGKSYALEPGWVFTLPFPPESLSIQSPYAIVTTSTMGGIVEEHNGQVFKNITFSGTTGLYPLKGTTELTPGPTINSLQAVHGIWGGTTSNTITNAVYAPKVNPKNIIPPELINPNKAGALTSGYYQCKVLEQFLENYVEAKKNSDNKNLRLAFAIWKDRAIYLTTPMQFVINRNAGSPLEYNYSLMLKAWKRVNDIAFYGLDVASYVAQNVASIVNTAQALSKAKEELEQAGISSNVYDNYSNCKLSLIKAKLDAGLGLSLGDLSAKLTGILFNKSCDVFSREPSTLDDAKRRVLENNTDSNADNITKALDTLKNSKTSKIDTSELATILDPSKCPYLYNSISVSSMNLSPYESKLINAETEIAKNLSKADYIKFKNEAKAYSNYLASSLGIYDVTFDETYNLPTINKQRDATDSDYRLLAILNDLVDVYNALIITASNSLENSALNNTLDYVAGLASGAGIAFNKSVSKYAVPFLYGYTMERFANLYLKNPDRWIEIATLNGLKAPYVDEDGFYLYLLANGSGNVISVSDSSNLYVNQKVTIGSSGYIRSVRHITKINKVTDSLSLITLDGEADLTNYTLDMNAYLYTFLPNTVNSSMMIYIPSNDPSTELYNDTINIPGVDTYDPILRITGFDILLDDKNDLIVTSDGDNRWAVGYQNVNQTLRLMVSTPRGSLLRHPSYGFAIEAGTSVADLDIKDYYNSINSTILSDLMFESVKGILAQLNGPTLKTKIAVKLKGANNLVPVTLDIPI